VNIHPFYLQEFIEMTAKERKEQYDNYDWWFCHRPLEK